MRGRRSQETLSPVRSLRSSLFVLSRPLDQANKAKGPPSGVLRRTGAFFLSSLFLSPFPSLHLASPWPRPFNCLRPTPHRLLFLRLCHHHQHHHHLLHQYQHQHRGSSSSSNSSSSSSNSTSTRPPSRHLPRALSLRARGNLPFPLAGLRSPAARIPTYLPTYLCRSASCPCSSPILVHLPRRRRCLPSSSGGTARGVIWPNRAAPVCPRQISGTREKEGTSARNLKKRKLGRHPAARVFSASCTRTRERGLAIGIRFAYLF